MNKLRFPAILRWVVLVMRDRTLGYSTELREHIKPKRVLTNEHWYFQIVNVHGEPIYGKTHKADAPFSDFIFVKPASE